MRYMLDIIFCLVLTVLLSIILTIAIATTCAIFGVI